MKIKQIVLSACLCLTITTVGANCVKATPDGWADCTTGQPVPEPKPLIIDNTCVQGVRAAYEAYMISVYDAGDPNEYEMSKALNFRLSQQPFPADKKKAAEALSFIASKLKNSGIRVVRDWQVKWIASKFINKECYK